MFHQGFVCDTVRKTGVAAVSKNIIAFSGGVSQPFRKLVKFPVFNSFSYHIRIYSIGIQEKLSVVLFKYRTLEDSLEVVYVILEKKDIENLDIRSNSPEIFPGFLFVAFKDILSGVSLSVTLVLEKTDEVSLVFHQEHLFKISLGKKGGLFCSYRADRKFI